CLKKDQRRAIVAGPCTPLPIYSRRGTPPWSEPCHHLRSTTRKSLSISAAHWWIWASVIADGPAVILMLRISFFVEPLQSMACRTAAIIASVRIGSHYDER